MAAVDPITAIANAVGDITEVVGTVVKNNFTKFQNVIRGQEKLFDYTAKQELLFGEAYVKQQEAQAASQRMVIIMIIALVLLLLVALIILKRR